MPVMYNAQVFPRIFTTDRDLGLPFLPQDNQIDQVRENRSLSLSGSLCFSIDGAESDCIGLFNQSFGRLENLWENETHWGGNFTVLYGRWPITNFSEELVKRPQPKLAPFCRGTKDARSPLPWSGCQARVAGSVGQYYSFSPRLGNVGYSSENDPSHGDPFDLWVLCGQNGSCTDLSTMSMLLGGRAEKETMSASLEGTGELVKSSIPGTKFSPTPVCVWPPFIWIVSNETGTPGQMICGAHKNCYYTLCWNATSFPLAVVARLPRFVPVPVEDPSSLILFREKRDFGLSAIIVGIIAATAVAASVTASALALTGTVQAADTINNLSAAVTTAMETQHMAYTQIQGGLLLVNQRIDLVQEQLDVLWQIAQLGCERRMPGLCITSIQFEQFTKAANLSKTLSQFLLQNWTAEFDQTLRELRTAIIQINSTRLDLSFTAGFSSWISSAFSYFKEWVGVGIFGVCLCFGLVFVLWLLCKMTRWSRRDKVMITQALLALEQGATAELWLSMLRQK